MSDALIDLLDAEAAALLAGDIDTAVGLAEDKARLVDGIGPEGAHRLRAKLERSARLLDAAAKGVRAARDRIAEGGNARGARVYGPGGTTETLRAAETLRVTL